MIPNPFAFILAIVIALLVGIVGGSIYGAHGEKIKQEAKQLKRDNEASKKLVDAFQQKDAAEKKNRDLNAQLGKVKREKDNAIDAAIDAVGGGLRASICVPNSTASNTASAGTGTNGSGTAVGGFESRTVDLTDVEREIKQLAKERDKCAAKVSGLQETVNGYHSMFGGYTGENLTP